MGKVLEQMHNCSDIICYLLFVFFSYLHVVSYEEHGVIYSIRPPDNKFFFSKVMCFKGYAVSYV